MDYKTKLYPTVFNPLLMKPARPHPKAVWVPGHWKWSRWQRRYVWVPGHWVIKKPGRGKGPKKIIIR